MVLAHHRDGHVLVGQVHLVMVVVKVVAVVLVKVVAVVLMMMELMLLMVATVTPGTSLGRVSLSALRPCFTSSSSSHSCKGAASGH